MLANLSTCVAGADTPPRLVSRIANHLGYSTFRLEHETYRIDQELLIDTGASLELLLLESIAQQLRLVQVPDRDIEIVGVGGTVRATLCNGKTFSCLPLADCRPISVACIFLPPLS